ncbi:DUF5777 family beta-barrel protein [Ulvibacter litoralis]|uniref:DUF5777 domain-containing protein n=1 Tax=Ulvibacter litoralis TaxID=227084 RepID=A0A1G7F3I0_9FLAO|nr:DUF5777 family beta-barrel protein [Ulvibacter litoralis]GHC52815.1 hypothetical protein GCM10008083_15940 [Ulvibacter litoralis]SDE70449.1 hypothetical protein SAMN05421855_102307 [Ulvibacter litoralis]
MRKISLLVFFISAALFSQEDLLSDLENDVIEDKTVIAAFKGLKVVNFESTKLASEGDIFFVVAHRFSSVKYGFDDFFGLDNAVTQLKFIYGVNEWLNVGVARSSYLKKYGVHVKYRLFPQEKEGFPVTIVGYNLVTANTSLDKDQYPKLAFENILTYTSQLLISRKISESLSLLVAPTFIHENLATRSREVLDNGETIAHDEKADQLALGLGGRYKLTKRMSVNLDYGLHLNRNRNSNYRNSLSVGVDIETGGHVFQMHFTNAQAMFEDGYIIQGQGDWSDGDVFFGFNISRVF